MAKKHKCIECENALNWAIPERVSENNLFYAKRCLDLANRSVCCDRTMKTKSKDHEQYCKYFEPIKYDLRDFYAEELENLSKMIEECERNMEGGVK